jgi:hypothetical protein
MPKLVIVVLVVVGVVFLITLGVGGCNHGGGADSNNLPGIVRLLGGGDGAFLRVEGDVRSSCNVVTPTRLTINGACAIVAPSRSVFTRPLRMAIRPTFGSVNVGFRPQGGGTQNGAIPGDAPCFEGAIDHRGAELALSCGGGMPCAVELAQAKC